MLRTRNISSQCGAQAINSKFRFSLDSLSFTVICLLYNTDSKRKGIFILNVLIMTGKFGMGHVSAAASIKEKIEYHDPSAVVHIVDVMDAFPRELGALAYLGFNSLVNKCPRIYNHFNKLSELHAWFPMKRIVAKGVDRMVKEYDPDMIISTVPFSGMFVSTYMKYTHNEIPLISCITDITFHKAWLSEKTEAYTVGSGSLKKRLVREGVPAGNVFVTGIPVRERFMEVRKPETAGKKHVLLMGGGLGLISSADGLMDALCIMDDVDVTVITGKNEKLREDLSENYPKAEIVGFTDKVSDYMAEADLLISKAGGITMFEAIDSETPMLVIKPFLEQEAGNAKFMERRGIGRVIWDKNADISTEIKALLSDEKALDEMKKT